MKVVQIFSVNQQIQHIVAWNESRLLLRGAFIFDVRLFVKLTFLEAMILGVHIHFLLTFQNISWKGMGVNIFLAFLLIPYLKVGLLWQN